LARVECAQDVAGDTFCVFGDETGVRRKSRIGAGVDMTDDLWILVEAARIRAAFAGCKADPIEISRVRLAAGSDFKING
jgi:hypothetical protein